MNNGEFARQLLADIDTATTLLDRLDSVTSSTGDVIAVMHLQGKVTSVLCDLLNLCQRFGDCLDEEMWYERGQRDARERKRIVGMGGSVTPQVQVERNMWHDYGDVALGAYRRGCEDYLRQFKVWH